MADYETHILTVGTGPPQMKDGVKIHYAPTLRPYTILYSSVLKPRLQSILREISPDILHSHIPLPWAYVYSRANCAKIVTCHGVDVFQNHSYPVRFFLKRALENANIVIAPSKWMAELIEQKYNVSCVTLPNGIDTDVFTPMKGVNTRNNVVLYVGRLSEAKGVIDLFEAAKELPEYDFWFVGPMKSAIQVPRLKNITIMGARYGVDLVTCYNQATLCAFPSHKESFSIVGLEALSCGKTIIATRLGFSEYVEDDRDGILVEPGRSTELISSIRHLIEDEQARKKLERNAREKALLYDWKPIMGRYRKLYSDVL